MKIKIFLVLSIFITLGYAQDLINPISSWKLVTSTKEDINIYTREISIINQKNARNDIYIQYRFDNKSNNELFLNWNFIRRYEHFNNSNAEQPNDENYRALYLKPKQNFIPSYTINNENLFFVFKEFKNKRSKAKLIDCELKNLKIKLL